MVKCPECKWDFYGVPPNFCPRCGHQFIRFADRVEIKKRDSVDLSEFIGQYVLFLTFALLVGPTINEVYPSLLPTSRLGLTLLISLGMMFSVWIAFVIANYLRNKYYPESDQQE
jgi:hypothetical protein